MRISFTGDDGYTERLAILNSYSDSSEVTVEEISADSSGRSFLIRLPGSEVVYFWCSEKSKIHGLGLLAKMKDLLRRRPTLSRLTGISESRLESFATYLRTHLLGSSNALEADPIAPSGESCTSIQTAASSAHSPSSVLKSSRSHSRESPASKGQPSYQDCLGPRSTTFKDGTIRCSSSGRSSLKEKVKRPEDNNNTSFISSKQTPSVSSSYPAEGQCGGHTVSEDNSISSNDAFNSPALISPSEMPSTSLPSSISSLLNLPLPQIDSAKPMFSPYYCWCPPCPSSLHYSVTSCRPLPISNNESIPLPPLSSLFSSGHPIQSVTSNLSSDFLKLPALNLPTFIPEPIVRLPLPVNSLVTLPTSQQIASFTPYMSDPIVHTPVIDVCSSGQGYLVSAGPAISSAVPPLMPSYVSHPLIPNTESAVEKSARETLRMLMASTPESTCQKPMPIFPPLIDKVGEKYPAELLGNNRGNQLLPRGVLDLEAIAMRFSSIGFPSSRDNMVVNGINKDGPDVCNSEEDSQPSSPNSEGCNSSEDSMLD